MNIFGTIEQVEAFPLVTYYTVRLEGEDTLLDQFLDYGDDSDQHEGLSIIRSALEKMGREIGAKARYFRPEQQAFALPPPSYIADSGPTDLRLYCLRLNDRVVILFNGGAKTTAKAQDCPRVGPLFRQANRLTKQIDEAIKHRELRFDPETDDLIIPEDFNVEL